MNYKLIKKNFIEKKSELKTLLNKLNGNEKPEFGFMTPQHMIEHLALSIKYSNGKAPQKFIFEEEMAKKIKFHIIQTENELKPGFKAPSLPVDRLLVLNDANIGEAIDSLINEIKTFEQFKRENSEV
tara:strand:- start:534 stop:914 length:381 start_codon:yes stop_codon:yes gene_type:complete